MCGTTRAAARFAGKGRLEEAEQGARGARRRSSRIPALPTLPASASLNTPDAILRIAPEVLAGEIAREAQGLRQGACCTSSGPCGSRTRLVYTEPPDWPSSRPAAISARRCSKPGRAVEAEAVYWDDLRRNPENGWSLFGAGCRR